MDALEQNRIAVGIINLKKKIVYIRKIPIILEATELRANENGAMPSKHDGLSNKKIVDRRLFVYVQLKIKTFHNTNRTPPIHFYNVKRMGICATHMRSYTHVHQSWMTTTTILVIYVLLHMYY